MVMTFPLPLADFWDRLLIAPGSQWVLSDNISSSRTDGGKTLRASRGVRLWSPIIRLGLMPNRAAQSLKMRLEKMSRDDATFLAYDKLASFPAADPEGLIRSGGIVTVTGVPASPLEIRIGGLPAHYVLTAGDMIGVLTGTGARSLFGVVDDIVTANGTGDTGVFNIEPARLAGVSSGDVVTVIKPTAVFQLVPGSYDRGTPGVVNTTGVSFSMIESRP